MTDVRERLRDAARLAPRPDEDPFGRLVSRRDRRRLHDRLLAGGVALLVAVAALGGGLFALRVASGPGRGIPGEGGPPRGLALQPGQLFYLKATIFLGEDGGRVDEETWWAPDGSGRIRSETNRPDKYVPLPPGRYDPGEFPMESDASGLSTDPAQLLDQLRARSASDGASPQPDVTPGGGLPLETGQLWRAIRRLLEYPNATPELRWALFEVAAGLEGVVLVNGAEDPVGRSAVALGLTAEGAEWNLYFDPIYHQLMSWYTEYQGGASATILDSGIVESTDEVPTSDQWLYPEASDLDGARQQLGGEWPPDAARSP